jgi:hypothetical protein
MDALRRLVIGFLMSTGLYSPPLDVEAHVPLDTALTNLGGQPRSKTLTVNGKEVRVRLRHSPGGRLRIRLWNFDKGDLTFMYSYTLTVNPSGEPTTIHATARPTLLGLVASLFWWLPVGYFATFGIDPARTLTPVGLILGVIFVGIPVGFAVSQARMMHDARKQLDHVIRELAGESLSEAR